MKRRLPRGRANGEMARPNRLPESVQVITIDRIAAGGDGVGRVDGLAVFVPRTAPGDVVQVAYVTHARHGRGRVLQVITPSSARVEPPCVHYVQDRCGGCQLQHLHADSQREARQHIVQDTLARIGRRSVPLPSLEAGAEWGYRSRLSLTLRRRGSSWIGGLHPHDDPTRVFALETCLIAHPVLVEVWASIRSVLRSGDVALPGAALPKGGSRPVDALRLNLRLDSASESSDALTVAIVLEGGTVWPEQAEWAEAVQRADRRIRGVWWTPDRAATLAADRRGQPRAETTSPAVEYAPQAREALAFAQVNAGVATRLRDVVYAAVTQFSPRRVIDGYAGTGLLTERLVQDGIRVVAIESDAAGAEAAVARLSALGAQASGGRVVCDLMEQALATLEVSADVIVLNPPRGGVHPDVTSWLEAPAQREMKGLVYVSCDAATLARDLARLPSWHVDAVQCFDMFPQTAHVETVCVLRRENA